MQHRPPVEAHVVEDEPLLRVKRGPERPAIPADLPALDGEADALGLRDLDGSKIVALRHRSGRVGAVGARDRLGVELLELQHAALVEVDIGDQALDRVGVAVVALVRAQVGDGSRYPPPLLDRKIEPARGEHVDLHERDVVDATPPQRGAPARVGAHRLCCLRVVLGRDGRARACRLMLRDDRFRLQVAHQLVHAVVAIDDDRERAATRLGPALEPGQVLALGRLLEADGNEASPLDLRAGECGCALELAGRERLERMRDRMLGHHGRDDTAIAGREGARQD